MSDEKCKPISSPHVMPGWGCCQCKVYNGAHRTACKNCGHGRCDPPEENK